MPGELLCWKGPGCTSHPGKAQDMAEALQSNATEMCQYTTGSKATLRAVLIPHERLCMEVLNTVTLLRFSWQWGRRWNPPSGNYPHPQGRANLPRHKGRDVSWRSHRAHAGAEDGAEKAAKVITICPGAMCLWHRQGSHGLCLCCISRARYWKLQVAAHSTTPPQRMPVIQAVRGNRKDK